MITSNYEMAYCEKLRAEPMEGIKKALEMVHIPSHLHNILKEMYVKFCLRMVLLLIHNI